MADILGTQGKIAGMEGIESAIVSVSIAEAGGGSIATTSATSANFAVNGTTGQLSNTSAIDFTIGSEDVGKIAAIVTINASAGTLITLDLDATKTLDSEGTASFAIGELTATL